MTTLRPEEIQLIGAEVALRWSDGREDYFPMEVLRAASPSAENRGEPDIFAAFTALIRALSFPEYKCWVLSMLVIMRCVFCLAMVIIPGCSAIAI